MKQFLPVISQISVFFPGLHVTGSSKNGGVFHMYINPARIPIPITNATITKIFVAPPALRVLPILHPIATITNAKAIKNDANPATLAVAFCVAFWLILVASVVTFLLFTTWSLKLELTLFWPIVMFIPLNQLSVQLKSFICPVYWAALALTVFETSLAAFAIILALLVADAIPIPIEPTVDWASCIIFCCKLFRTDVELIPVTIWMFFAAVS